MSLTTRMMIRNETFTPTTAFRTLSDRVTGPQAAAQKVVSRVETAADQVTLLGQPDPNGQITVKGHFTANAGALTRMVRNSAYGALEGVAGGWHPTVGARGTVGFEGSVGPNESGNRCADIRMTKSRTLPEDYYGPAETRVHSKSMSILEHDGKTTHTINDGGVIQRVVDNGNGTLTYQMETLVPNDRR